MKNQHSKEELQELAATRDRLEDERAIVYPDDQEEAKSLMADGYNIYEIAPNRLAATLGDAWLYLPDTDYDLVEITEF